MKELITVSELVKKIAHGLDLDGKATEDASEGRPAENAKTLSDSESQIVSALVNEVKIKVDWFEEKYFEPLNDACKALRRKLPEDEEQRNTLNNKDNYNFQIQETQERSTAYEAFQDDRKEILAGREAKPGSGPKFFAWMAIVVIVEGGLNAYFFSKASETGLAGGFLIACLIALANVSIAGIGSHWGARYMLNHLKWPNKIFGGIWMLVCIVICLFVISIAAAYRGHVDALVVQNLPLDELSSKASSGAMTVITNGDFSKVFESFEAGILFVIGVACALLSGIKSYHINDPCPGYAAVHGAKIDAYDKSTKIMKDRIDEIRAAISTVRDCEKNIDKAEVEKINVLPELAKQVGCELLKKYRNKNREMRGDAGITNPPAYFDDPLDPQGISGKTTTGKYLIEQLDQIGCPMRQKIADMEQNIDRLVDKAEREIDNIEANTKNLEGIVQEAAKAN